MKWLNLTTVNPMSNQGAMTICCRVLISTMMNYYSRIYLVSWTTLLTHSVKVIPIPTQCAFPSLAALGGCTHGIYCLIKISNSIYLFIYQYWFGASFRKVSQRLNRITGSSLLYQHMHIIRHFMLCVFLSYILLWLQSLNDYHLKQSF